MKQTVIFALTVVGLSGCGIEPPSADTILVNGRIFTADSTRPAVEAVAIRGDRILAVGTTSEIDGLAGKATRRIDLADRVAIPGINDAHTHFYPRSPDAYALGAFSEMDPAWTEVRAAVAAAARDVEAGTTITGVIGVRVIEDPTATRFALDSLAPDHPVILNTFYRHGDLLNTLALREFGVVESEPDPPGGFYERVRGTDRLNGKIFEYAQWRLSHRAAAEVDGTDMVAQLRAFSDEAIRFGITSIQDMPFMPTERFVDVLVEADIPLRVRVIRLPMTDANGRMVDDGADLPRHPDGKQRITVSGVKWIVDGTPLERGAALRGDYADRAGWQGRANFPPNEIAAMIRESVGRDEPLLLHIVGDRTTEMAFDAMEALDDVPWPLRRVRIEHGEGIVADLIPRAVRLGIIVVQNPTHFALAPIMHQRWGSDFPYQRFRTLQEAGVPIALGSDGALNPYLNIMLATLHPTDPSEAITRERAVEAYTRGAAYAEFEEHRKGTLAEGMLADIAVLSQDIFAVPPPELPGTVSILTIIGGEVVYDAGVLDGGRGP